MDTPALANDKYRATLRSTFVDGVDTTLAVTAIPANLPTIVTVGWNTQYETKFRVEGTSGTNSSNYALTGIEKIAGFEGNIPENSAVNCLNNEDFFNQYGVLIEAAQEDAAEALAAAEEVEAVTDGWQTLALMPGFLKPTTTGGCGDAEKVEAGTNDVDYDVLPFDKASDERAFANVPMPDIWNGGVINFRFFWTAAGGSAAETVEMTLKGRSYANDDAIDQAGGTAVEVSDALIATGDIHISDWSGDITITGAGAGEYVHFELMRDVSEDNLDADARILGIQIRFKQTFA